MGLIVGKYLINTFGRDFKFLCGDIALYFIYKSNLVDSARLRYFAR